MSLYHALVAAYPGITVGPSLGEAECVLLGDKISGWRRAEPKPSEAALLAAYDPMPDAKANRIASINAECRARLIARFGPAEEQVSRSVGVYGAAEQQALASGIAATIDASNTAQNAILAAADIAAVEAVTVTWPVI